MGLRVLGPPELVAGGRSFDIGPPRARVVLSMLALNANRVTPVEQLIDAVWDTSPPATARSQIQICVSALRKRLQDTGQPIAIRTRPPGYLLEVGTGELDVDEFGRLVTVARHEADRGSIAEAAAALRSALALWQGPALAGVPGQTVQRAAARLDERRLAATEERVRLDLALGRHEEVSGELRALVDEQPLREQLHELLMLALYRAGRQAEALEVYRKARATLVDEVGIEPGRPLQDLEQAILHRDPTLNAPTTTTNSDTASGPITADGGTTDGRITAGGGTTNGPITAGGGTTNGPIAAGGATAGGPIAADGPITAGEATTNGPIAAGGATADGPIAAGRGTTDGPITAGGGTTDGPIAVGGGTAGGAIGAGGGTAGGAVGGGGGAAGGGTADGPIGVGGGRAGGAVGGGGGTTGGAVGGGGGGEGRVVVTPYQLPASIADFTGRDEQLASIRRLLDETDPASSPYAMRVVTISGAGGVGKSCLAVRAAHELAEAFPDGHLYAELQAAGGEASTARVLARFLRALGIAGAMLPDDLQERAEMYRSRLAGKRVLVVLDAVTSEEQVLPLLPGSPTCAVITTSRSRLGGLSGAHGLDVGVFDVEGSLELLAKIVGPERVAAEHDPAVELVRFCDGLPLALRIAGARLASRPHWPIGGLVTRLADEARRLDELSHHGLELRSNIGLTYRSLDEPAKRLFRLFALLQVPDFPAWTAAALLDTDLASAEDVLEGLVDAQLLSTVSRPDTRYQFHELVRVFAAEELARTESDGDRLAALRRVVGGWMGLAEQAHRMTSGGDYAILHGSALRWSPPGSSPADLIRDPIGWLESERRALVAAVRQAAATGLDELCWDLAFNLITLFELKGYFDDWRETSRLALDLTERTGNRLGHAAMLHSLGTLHLFQKRLDESTRDLTASAGLFRQLGHVHGEALSLRNLAMVDELREDHPRMLARYAESLEAVRAVGDRHAEAQILRSLGRYEMYHGDVDRARELLTEALAIVEEVHTPRGEAQIRVRFGELYTHIGEYELASEAHHRALRLVRDMDDRIGEAYVLHGLGVNEHRQGKLDAAKTTLGRALALAEVVGERFIEAQTHHELGIIASATGDRTAAITHLDRADTLFGELGSQRRRATVTAARASLTDPG